MKSVKQLCFMNKQGFTLIEILVVILILGLLASIVGPKLFGHADEAKVTKTKVQLENISTALKMYKLDTGVFPSTEQGLQALVAPPQGGDAPKKWRTGGYMEKGQVPKDGWDNEYIYMSPGTHGDFDLFSYGADGVPGGEEYNKDINNWDAD